MSTRMCKFGRELTRSACNVPKFDHRFMPGRIKILIRDHRGSLPAERQGYSCYKLNAPGFKTRTVRSPRCRRNYCVKSLVGFPASSSPFLHHDLVLDSSNPVVGTIRERATRQCQGHVDVITRNLHRETWPFFHLYFWISLNLILKNMYVDRKSETTIYISITLSERGRWYNFEKCRF